MISEKIINILKENSQFNDFIKDIENFEVLIKELNQDDIKRLSFEYPELLKQINIKVSESISSITFIKNSSEVKNHFKLKKFKFYIDELDGKILKILQN